MNDMSPSLSNKAALVNNSVETESGIFVPARSSAAQKIENDATGVEDSGDNEKKEQAPKSKVQASWEELVDNPAILEHAKKDGSLGSAVGNELGSPEIELWKSIRGLESNDQGEDLIKQHLEEDSEVVTRARDALKLKIERMPASEDKQKQEKILTTLNDAIEGHNKTNEEEEGSLNIDLSNEATAGRLLKREVDLRTQELKNLIDKNKKYRADIPAMQAEAAAGGHSLDALPLSVFENQTNNLSELELESFIEKSVESWMLMSQLGSAVEGVTSEDEFWNAILNNGTTSSEEGESGATSSETVSAEDQKKLKELKDRMKYLGLAWDSFSNYAKTGAQESSLRSFLDNFLSPGGSEGTSRGSSMAESLGSLEEGDKFLMEDLQNKPENLKDFFETVYGSSGEHGGVDHLDITGIKDDPEKAVEFFKVFNKDSKFEDKWERMKKGMAKFVEDKHGKSDIVISDKVKYVFERLSTNEAVMDFFNIKEDSSPVEETAVSDSQSDPSSSSQPAAA